MWSSFPTISSCVYVKDDFEPQNNVESTKNLKIFARPLYVVIPTHNLLPYENLILPFLCVGQGIIHATRVIATCAGRGQHHATRKAVATALNCQVSDIAPANELINLILKNTINSSHLSPKRLWHSFHALFSKRRKTVVEPAIWKKDKVQALDGVKHCSAQASRTLTQNTS